MQELKTVGQDGCRVLSYCWVVIRQRKERTRSKSGGSKRTSGRGRGVGDANDTGMLPYDWLTLY